MSFLAKLFKSGKFELLTDSVVLGTFKGKQTLYGLVEVSAINDLMAWENELLVKNTHISLTLIVDVASKATLKEDVSSKLSPETRENKSTCLVLISMEASSAKGNIDDFNQLLHEFTIRFSGRIHNSDVLSNVTYFVESYKSQAVCITKTDNVLDLSSLAVSDLLDATDRFCLIFKLHYDSSIESFVIKHELCFPNSNGKDKAMQLGIHCARSLAGDISTAKSMINHVQYSKTPRIGFIDKWFGDHLRNNLGDISYMNKVMVKKGFSLFEGSRGSATLVSGIAGSGKSELISRLISSSKNAYTELSVNMLPHSHSEVLFLKKRDFELSMTEENKIFLTKWLVSAFYLELSSSVSQALLQQIVSAVLSNLNRPALSFDILRDALGSVGLWLPYTFFDSESKSHAYEIAASMLIALDNLLSEDYLLRAHGDMYINQQFLVLTFLIHGYAMHNQDARILAIDEFPDVAPDTSLLNLFLDAIVLCKCNGVALLIGSQLSFDNASANEGMRKLLNTMDRVIVLRQQPSPPDRDSIIDHIFLSTGWSSGKGLAFMSIGDDGKSVEKGFFI